jgi:Flp pilus assembly protein TadB
MMEIFLIQLLAAGLGALTTAWADWSYNGAQIGRRLHALWVATSIAVICLPVVTWTSMVFLGSGLLGQLVAGTIVVAVFLWVYRNLPKPRQIRKFGPGLPDARGAAPFPPASRLDGRP